MLSASGDSADAARLQTWWAVSGSTHLTMKMANDARATQSARRTGGTRGAYAGKMPITGDPFTANTTTPVVAVASASATTAAAVAAPVTLPVMPNSDSWYSAIVNANNYVTSPYYQPYLSPKLGLITDLSGTSQQTWTEAVATTQANHPQTLIGTYHSMRDAQLASTFTTYPRRAVAREGLTSRQILMTDPGYPDAQIVDYRQAAARKYLVKNVVDDVARTGSRLAFLDNVSHHETGFPIDWTTTTSVLKEMVTNLKAQGRRVIANASWTPGVTSNQSVDQLIATGVDGVTLEMGFSQYVRGDVARVNLAMQQYRKMLDSGMTVVFIGLGSAAGLPDTIENSEAEQRVQAAFGMMFRKPGDRLFANHVFWRPTPEWSDWTERFGPALGAATVARNAEGQIVMTRQFTNYKLTLNTTTNEVTTEQVTAPAP